MESGRDGGEVNGDVKETPSSVVTTSKSEEPRNEKQQQHVANMGKQNGEDLDEGAQERMLQGDDGNAKITEKDNIEVNEDALSYERSRYTSRYGNLILKNHIWVILMLSIF